MRTIIDARTASDHFPGIGRYTYSLARAIAREGALEQLLLIVNPKSINTRFDLASLKEQCGVRLVETSARSFSLREQLQLPSQLRKLSADVLHYPYTIMPLATPRPYVLTVHDIIPIRFPQYFSLLQRMLYRMSLTISLHSAACVICVSEATRSELKSVLRVEADRLFVAHEGVSEAFRPSARHELERVRTRYGLPEDYLLYVGSNKPHKNLASLLDAYAGVHSAPTLVLAGAQDHRYQKARRRVSLLNLEKRVRFLDSVMEKDLPALYGGATAFLYPSIYEGFGLPPLEAMACGVPVVCSDIPSLIETTGDAALKFDPTDTASIAAAVERIVEDGKLRTDLKDRGLRHSAAFSWKKAAEVTVSLYRRAATG
jgi:alpha-1,3-rhamnosyl/mannosyltransferase